jgi:hypothetical protein
MRRSLCPLPASSAAAAMMAHSSRCALAGLLLLLAAACHPVAAFDCTLSAYPTLCVGLRDLYDELGGITYFSPTTGIWFDQTTYDICHDTLSWQYLTCTGPGAFSMLCVAQPALYWQCSGHGFRYI